MSDDTRSTKTRRLRPRILVVNNPSPDEPSGSDDDRPVPPHAETITYDYHSRPLPSPAHSAPVDRSQQSSTSQVPPPVTTNMSEQRPYYPSSSRSNPSNPTLSSPSSTSSPAFESTPPPSTPGQSIPPVDLQSDRTFRQDVVILSTPTPDRTDGCPPSTSRPAKLYASIKNHLSRPRHGRHSSNNSSRPSSSPTTGTSDSYPPYPLYGATTNEKITLLVTRDADSFSLVDISGAMTPAFIRERIFSKLQIADEEQPHYSIYRTEIGEYAIGDALTDEQLFELSRMQGDDKGTVKLLVSHSSVAVHEPPHDVGLVSPTVNVPPPPVLPQLTLHPLRPVPRNRSRHGSQSSASEQQQVDVSGEYDASVSDDELGDHEPRRNTVRPPAQSWLPNNSQTTTSPVVNRPHSPTSAGGNTMRSGSDSPAVRPDGPRGIASTAPLSISPRNQRNHDVTSRWNHHSVPSPDGTVEDRSIPPNEGRAESPEKYRRTAYGVEDRLKQGREREREVERRKEGLIRKEGPPNASNQTATLDGWTMVSSETPTSDYKGDRPATPQDARSPSSRYPGMSTRYSPFLARAPMVGIGEPLNRMKRHKGQPVPANWPVLYKEPMPQGKADSHPVPKVSRMLAKSMTDMRNAYKQSHPPALQPGRPSKPQQPVLPVTPRPSTGGSVTSGTGVLQSSSSAKDASYSGHSSAGRENSAQRSYEAQRGGTPQAILSPPRPTMYQSPSGTGIVHLGATSPGQDPYPRPRSALDERGDSPVPPYGMYISPKSERLVQETTSSRPAPLSPPTLDHRGHSNQGGLIREDAFSVPFKPSAVPLVEQHSALHNAAPSPSTQVRRGPRTPPRSPDVLQPAQQENRGTDPGRTASHPPQREPVVFAGSDRGVLEESVSSESTMRRDEHALWEGLVDENAIEGTIMPRLPPAKPLAPLKLSEQLSHSFSDNSANGTMMSEARSADDDDDSEDDSLFWAVPPQKSSERSQKSSLKTNARPALARLSIDGTPSISSSSATPQNPDTSKQPPPNFPAPPSYIPSPPPLSRRTNPRSANATRKPQADRASRFDRDDDTWAPRPPPEDVYDRLDQFFPEHDLDHPVIEMPSGGSSPTSTDNPAPAPHRSRHKKSIRVVAEERKNWIDRNSRLHNSSGGANLWKRNTKLWDSKLEEVTTQLAKADIPPLPQDSSPSVQTRPIFRWVRGQLIGKGTYGKVYLALNATTGDMIAVKQVEMPRTASDKSDTRQISVVEALKLESETLKDLDHPNIVQYLGFEETPTFLSIFLEYVPGGSIASCLRKYGSFDEDVTKSFTGQILDGLDYLHSKGILHRDLKADNILVETTGICKISDFGISKRTEDVNVIGEYTSMQGSVFWMAPEVINSQQRGYNSKIDIWSVGCVVYEMWTGERPWNGQEAVAVLIRLYQTKEAPPVPDDICLSPLADDFRRKCFAMNPDERPSAAELRKHSYLELQPGWTFNSFKQPD